MLYSARAGQAFRSGIVGFGVVAALVTLPPAVSHAVPVAGDYVFSAGLAGSFHSNGTFLDSWHMQIPDTAAVFDDTFSNQVILRNDSQVFWDRNVLPFITVDYFDLVIVWPLNFSQLSVKLIDREDVVFDHPSIIEYFPTSPTAVPEPPSISLLMLAILALLGYGWRKQRQARLMIG